MIFSSSSKAPTSLQVERLSMDGSCVEHIPVVKVKPAYAPSMLWKRIKVEPKLWSLLRSHIRYQKKLWQTKLIPYVKKEKSLASLKSVMRVTKREFALFLYFRKEHLRTYLLLSCLNSQTSKQHTT